VQICHKSAIASKRLANKSHDVRILLTQSTLSQQPFFQHCPKHWQLVACPMIGITSAPRLSAHKKRLIAAAELTILVSPNAAHYGALHDDICINHTKIIAMGPQTAHVAQSHGLCVDYPDTATYDSKRLIGWLSTVTASEEKAIIALCGSNHRAELGKQLREAGAFYQKITCYQTQTPQMASWHTLSVETAQSIQGIVSQSLAGLSALNEAAQQLSCTWVYNTPLFVISTAMMQLAKKVGFLHIHQAKSAHHLDLINSISRSIP